MRWKAFIFLLIWIWLASAQSALAHANVLRVDPASGGVYPVGSLSRVSLEFDEVLEPSFGSIEVFNSSLERVDTGPPQLDSVNPRIYNVDLAELTPDSYTVVWMVVSAVDSHSTSGVYTFRIVEEGRLDLGNGGEVLTRSTLPPSTTAPVSIWEVGLRWLRLMIALIVFGALLIVPTVHGPLRREATIKEGKFWTTLERASNRLQLGATLLWFLAGIVWLGWQSVVVSQTNLAAALANGVPFRLIKTRFGVIWILQQMIALAMLGLQWRRRDHHRSGLNSQWAAEILASAGILGSLALSSHAAAGSLWSFVSTSVDWLHLVSNGAWIGGLIALTFVFMPSLRYLPEETRRSVRLQALGMFSPVAVVGVLLAVTSGAFSAALHFLVPSDLIETQFGLVFLLKMAVVGLMILIGLANTLTLGDKWTARLNASRGRLQNLRARLGVVVRVEAVLGLLVLLTTAWLTSLPTPPPRALPPDKQIPFNSELREISLPKSDLKAFIALAPNYIGWNRYLIVLQDTTGNPITDAERVRLRFYLPKVDVRTDWVTSQPAENGLYSASGQELVVVGDWQIEIDIRKSEMADVRFTLDWKMEPVPITQVDPAQPRLANWLALGCLALVLAALVFQALRRLHHFFTERLSS